MKRFILVKFAAIALVAFAVIGQARAARQRPRNPPGRFPSSRLTRRGRSCPTIWPPVWCLRWRSIHAITCGMLHPSAGERAGGKTPAPPVLEFDANGKYLQGWGGASDAYEWPDSEHGIYVADNGDLWIGGSSPWGHGVCRFAEEHVHARRRHAPQFTTQGKFLLQIGRRSASTGNADQKNVHSATEGVGVSQ